LTIKKNVGLKIIARNEKELKRILNGIKRKNPTLDISKELKSAVKSESSLDTQIEFSIENINSDEIYRTHLVSYSILKEMSKRLEFLSYELFQQFNR
jgi:hypothetical protein